MKLSLVIAALVIFVGLIFNAQERDVERERRWLTVSEIAVEAAGEGETGVILRIGGNYAADCGTALQSEVGYFPANVEVQVFHEVPVTETCGEDATFVLEVALEDGWDGEAIVVNDQVWSAVAVAGVLEYRELSRFPLQLHEAGLRLMDAGAEWIQFRLRGNQAVGCRLPILFSVRETSESLVLSVFNAMAAETVCPDALIEFDEAVTVPATEVSADTLLVVNGYVISELESESMSENDKVLTNIMRVDVTVTGAAPAKISLDVAGEHPDGCDYPVLLEQRRQGNRIDIEVYREVPMDVICPMILRPYSGTIDVDGTLESGEYTITVNSHSQTIDV